MGGSDHQPPSDASLIEKRCLFISDNIRIPPQPEQTISLSAFIGMIDGPARDILPTATRVGSREKEEGVGKVVGEARLILNRASGRVNPVLAGGSCCLLRILQKRS